MASKAIEKYAPPVLCMSHSGNNLTQSNRNSVSSYKTIEISRQAASVPNSSILFATEVGGNRPWKRRNGRTCWLTKVPDFVSVNLQFVVNNMSTCSLLAGFYLREVLGTVCCIVVE